MESVKQRVEKFRELNAYRHDHELWEKRGFQVIMSVFSGATTIAPAIQSLEYSMRGLDWVFLFGDDGSTDNTVQVANDAKSYTSAKEYNVFEFGKAVNVSEAKNRLAKISKEYSEDYPGILFIDADDLLYKKKARGLYSTAKEKNANITIGNWRYVNARRKKYELKTVEESFKRLTFGPWNTLIHSSLIPEDGLFWSEELGAHADLLMWWELVAAGVEFALSDTMTTKYNSTYGSVSKDTRIGFKQLEWQRFLKARDAVIEYGDFSLEHTRDLEQEQE